MAQALANFNSPNFAFSYLVSFPFSPFLIQTLCHTHTPLAQSLPPPFPHSACHFHIFIPLPSFPSFLYTRTHLSSNDSMASQ